MNERNLFQRGRRTLLALAIAAGVFASAFSIPMLTADEGMSSAEVQEVAWGHQRSLGG